MGPLPPVALDEEGRGVQERPGALRLGWAVPLGFGDDGQTLWRFLHAGRPNLSSSSAPQVAITGTVMSCAVLFGRGRR